MKKTLIYFTALSIFIASCSKNDSIKNTKIETPEKAASTSYLKFKDANEFFSEINTVSKMNDQEYSNWKLKNNLQKTLFDRFVLAQLTALSGNGEIKNTVISSTDSNYFYFDGEQLFSKNGVMLDRVLNENGVVKIGDFLLRYQNRNLYYVQNADLKSENLINKRDISNSLLQSTIDDYNSKTKIRAVDHYVNPIWGQTNTFLYNLKSQRFDYSNRRHFVNLKEQYILVPNQQTSSWSIGYNLYFEFGQHKKVLFSWNTYPSATYCEAINILPNDAVRPFFPYDGVTGGGSSWCFLQQTYSSPGGYLLLPASGTFQTANATSPTFSIFSSTASTNQVISALPTAKIKLNARLKTFDTNNHDFYYDSQID